MDAAEVDLAAVSQGGPIAGPGLFTHFVDHYKCYWINRDGQSPKYWPSGVERHLIDDFEDRRYRLSRPTRLCMPVDVDGSSVKQPEGKLFCYKAKRGKGEASHQRISGLNTGDLFGAGVL